jgi:cellulose synthase/poly-beta-1,6-N-acetylglucosamine synthase-like glycosyltransferase
VNPVGADIRRRSPAFASRVVVAVVVTIMIVITTLAVIVARTSVTNSTVTTLREITVAGRQILVSRGGPPLDLVLFSLVAVVLIAGCCLGLEVIAALLSISPPRAQFDWLRHRSKDRLVATRIRITVLVPAHNEEAALPVTLEALTRQTRQPDRVIVVADNCTDRTVEIALAHGAEAFETVENVHKKGGALNQVLTRILPDATAEDVVLVMDADTSLSERFLEVAARQLQEEPELSAVGGVFFGEEGHGLLGQLQRNEYARYGLQIQQRRGRVFVLTGTATMFRSEALLDVAAARGIYLPGETGQVYDTAALTEDNELTIALKSLGAMMMSPLECRVTTELMPSWRYLWRQRQRWQRGALENIGAYGLTRGSLRYWGQQIGIGYGAVALNAYLLLMAITILALDRWIWFPFWILVGTVFWVERVITAWPAGWRGRLVAAALFIEIAYDVFLQVVFVSCLVNITLSRTAAWGDVVHAPAEA